MSSKNDPKTKSNMSLDWLVRGVLTKLGDTFDKLTGRKWNPSSGLATSELIEKIKILLDKKVRDLKAGGKFAPHNIGLKMQWDKFSVDSESDLQKLEYELHAAIIDHINDRGFYTYAPINLEIKTDYFTEGVKLLVNFGEFAEEGEEDTPINVTVPSLQKQRTLPDEIQKAVHTVEQKDKCFVIRFETNGKPNEIELDFGKKRRRSVGRLKKNDVTIIDQSISKIHASLVLNSENKLLVADTGSTNGTFVNDKRIAYGKAVEVEEESKVKFGTVEILIEHPQIIANAEVVENVEMEVEGTEVFEKDEMEVEKNKPEETERAATSQVQPKTPPLQKTEAQIQPTEAFANVDKSEGNLNVAETEANLSAGSSAWEIGMDDSIVENWDVDSKKSVVKSKDSSKKESNEKEDWEI